MILPHIGTCFHCGHDHSEITLPASANVELRAALESLQAKNSAQAEQIAALQAEVESLREGKITVMRNALAHSEALQARVAELEGMVPNAQRVCVCCDNDLLAVPHTSICRNYTASAGKKTCAICHYSDACHATP